MHCYQGKTVLITGATGLIGSHIVKTLMETQKNIRVIALSRSEEKLKHAFECYCGLDNFRYVAQDICKPLETIEDETIDVIFHAAGSMEGKVIAEKPMSVISANIVGTINCLEFLNNQQHNREHCGKLVLFSSVTVYGNCTSEDCIVTEADTQVTGRLDDIAVAYAQSKRMSEVIAQAYHRQYGTNIVIARLSTVYGDTIFLPDTAFFQFVQNALHGKNIILKGQNLPKRDNIYIDDAVSGLLLLGCIGENGEAYNVSSGGEAGCFVAVDEIAEMIAKRVNAEFGFNVRVIQAKDNNMNRKPGIKLSNEKLKRLGWKLQTSMQEGINKTIHGAKQNH